MIIQGDHFQVHYDEVKPEAVETDDGWRGIDIRFLVGEAVTKNSDMTLWRATFSPNARHARHTHTVGEAFFVISGRGAAGTGDEEYEVTAGSALYVPPNTVHWFRNLDESEPVQICGVYAPGGSLEGSGYSYVGEIEDHHRKVGR